MRSIAIAGAWLMIGLGFGIILRAILVTGRNNNRERNDDY